MKLLDSVHPETSSFIDTYMSDIAIGNLVNGGDVLEGGIDEVAIWHRALSADEIAALAGL